MSNWNPSLKAANLVGALAPGQPVKVDVVKSIPHLYAYPGQHRLRYRVHIDASYLNQSRAAVDVWNEANQQWNELASLNVDHEFYMVQGPDVDPANPKNRELGSPRVVRDAKAAANLAKSWNKVYVALGEVAKELLDR